MYLEIFCAYIQIFYKNYRMDGLIIDQNEFCFAFLVDSAVNPWPLTAHALLLYLLLMT
jgi:hypothetical protein